MKRSIFFKVAAVFLTSFLMHPFFSGAAATKGDAAGQQYYLVPLIYDSSNNNISLDSSQQISLTKENLVKDIGSGSQFYVRVLNDKSQPFVFRDGNTKVYLGKWESADSKKSTEIKVTVPYFKAGQKIAFFDVKEKKLRLMADVSRLAVSTTTKTVAAAGDIKKTVKKAAVQPTAANARTYQLNSSSSRYLWGGVIILVVVSAGVLAFWFYRRRKKKAMQAAGLDGLPKK